MGKPTHLETNLKNQFIFQTSHLSNQEKNILRKPHSKFKIQDTLQFSRVERCYLTVVASSWDRYNILSEDWSQLFRA